MGIATYLCLNISVMLTGTAYAYVRERPHYPAPLVVAGFVFTTGLFLIR